MKEDIYTKKGQAEYAKYLQEIFGNNADKVIDEMLKVCPLGSDLHMLKDVQKYLKENPINGKAITEEKERIIKLFEELITLKESEIDDTWIPVHFMILKNAVKFLKK